MADGSRHPDDSLPDQGADFLSAPSGAPSPDEAERGLLSNSAITLGAQLLQVGLAGISSVVAARALGPSGRGIVATAALGPGLVGLVLALGIGIANVYYTGRREVPPGVALGTSLGLGLMVSLVAVPVYVITALVLRDRLLHHLALRFILLGSLLIPLSILLRYLLGVVQGLRRIPLLNLSNITQSATVLAAYTVALLILHLGPTAALVGLIGAAAFGMLPAIIALRRAYPKWRWSGSYARKAFRFGTRGEIGNVMQLLNYRLDVFLVAAFLGFSAVGLYAVAFTLAELFWQIPSAIALVLFPTVAAGGQESAGVTAQLCRLNFAMLVLAGVVAWVVAPIAIPAVFSSRFSDSVPAFRALLPGVVLFGLTKLLSAHLTGRGHPGISSISAAVALVITVGLDVWLIPRIGIVGASLASSGAYGVATCIVLVFFLSTTGTGLRDVILVRWSDVTFAWRRLGHEARRLATSGRSRRHR